MIELTLTEDCEVAPDGDDAVLIRARGRQLRFGELPPAAHAALLRVGAGWVEWPGLAPLVDDEQLLQQALNRLSTRMLLRWRVSADNLTVIESWASGTDVAFAPPRRHLPERVRLSRFVLVTSDGPHLVAESTTHHTAVRIVAPWVAAMIAATADTTDVSDLSRWGPQVSVSDVTRLLLLAGMVQDTGPEGRLAEDDDPRLRQRTVLDTALHVRSRRGLAGNRVVGASYPFAGSIPATPALKPAMSANPLPLPRPDMDHLYEHDHTLASVMDARRSVRYFGREPITVEQLGEFLFRTARVRKVTPRDRDSARSYETSGRSYPTGGASYDLEIYLTVRACAGLAPGFYHYEPQEHALSAVDAPHNLLRKLLRDAHAASGRRDMPQVLFTLASRFTRLSWKYEGIAYTTTLKNVGVLYEAMYLVATSMGLGPCALGAGNAATFATITGLDPLVESSVGEFMLGTVGEPPGRAGTSTRA